MSTNSSLSCRRDRRLRPVPRRGATVPVVALIGFMHAIPAGGGLPQAMAAPGAALGIGPDARVHLIGSGVLNYGPEEDHRAYSFGLTQCNVGDEPMLTVGADSRHPVMAFQMYRLAPGANGHLRFEQIGHSWCFHVACSLDQNACAPCAPAGCAALGPGCSDAHSATAVSSQPGLGSRLEVDSTSGAIAFPPQSPPFSGSTARRLRAAVEDVASSLNPGAAWFVEATVVHLEDAPAIDLARSADNTSHRELTMGPDGTAAFPPGSSTSAVPAILRWSALDSAVFMSEAIVPAEGRVLVASRAYENGDGTFDYEYAIYNQDLDRAIRSVTIPLPPDAAPTAIGQRLPVYHSNDLILNSPWSAVVETGALTWSTVTFDQAPSAGALRWGMLGNFRFTSPRPPADAGAIELALFTPGATMSIMVSAIVPSAASACDADLDGSGTVDFGDALLLLAQFGRCDACPADLDGNGSVEFTDLLLLLSAWGDCAG